MKQVELHPSKLIRFPSSHLPVLVSTPNTSPSPQIGEQTERDPVQFHPF